MAKPGPKPGVLKKGSLRSRIMRVLDSSPLPVPTADLIALECFGKSRARARVWGALRYLLRFHRVRKVKPANFRRGPGINVRWQSTLFGEVE